MEWIQFQRFAKKLQRKYSDWRGTSGQVYLVNRVGQYRDVWERVAGDIGADFIELAPDLWEIRRGEQSTRINNYLLQLDDPVVLNLAGRKPLVHKLLIDKQLPVPEHAVFGLGSLETAQRFVADHPLGSVIKPGDGYGGKGVTTHITERSAVREAAILASVYSRNLLIEAQVVGECFRILVFDGEVLSAVRRTGARVTGDGVTPLRGLIARAGFDVDTDCRFTLAAQRLALRDVPAKDAVTLAKSNRVPGRAAELRTVYDTDVTEQLHETAVRAAEQAADAVGSRFCGVDIISADITRPLDSVGACINEVNTTPALLHHYDSKTEAYPAVALTIINKLLTPIEGPSS